MNCGTISIQIVHGISIVHQWSLIKDNFQKSKITIGQLVDLIESCWFKWVETKFEKQNDVNTNSIILNNDNLNHDCKLFF